MGTPTAYLAGAINGMSDFEAKTWRGVAARELQAHGWRVLDPMSRDYRGIELENVTEIVQGDLCDISQAHVMLVRAEQPSWGTAMELVYAHEFGCKIIAFGAGPRPSPWLVYHADHLAVDLDDALRELARMQHDVSALA